MSAALSDGPRATDRPAGGGRPHAGRVLLVHQPTDGGVGRHVSDLAGGLAERGHEVFLCGPARLEGAPADVAFRRLDLRRTVDARADPIAALDLARVVGEVRPTVVHAHSSKAGAVARLARVRHPGIPLVYSPHGYAFNGHFERSWERPAYRGVERLLAPIASRVIGVCEAEARLARSVGPARRVRVVHNGIDPAPAAPPDPRLAALAGAGPVLGALTLLRPGKGLETLIDAAPEVLGAHPGAQLAIVGEGPDLAALRDRARALAVDGSVHFLGPTRDPLGVLRGMDVFVHPSWAESFPYVILEAMSVGRPIVASDVGGVDEALGDGHSGLLVAPRDARALAGALVGLLDDDGRRQRMGIAARERVEQDFTRSAMIGGVAAVYDEVVS